MGEFKLPFSRRKVVYAPKALSATKSGLIREHRIIAEKALGKRLPKGAVVHHHSDKQLVICQDQGYHNLLAKRTIALRECGHASWTKCRFCNQYGPKDEVLLHNNWNNYHRECERLYEEKRSLNA